MASVGTGYASRWTKGGALYLYSAWLSAYSSVRELEEIVGNGAEDTGSATGGSGRLIRLDRDFVHQRATPWEESTTRGTWTCAVAVLGDDSPPDERHDRPVGVVAPTPSLVEDLSRATATLLARSNVQSDEWRFSIRNLLRPDAHLHRVKLVSARVVDGPIVTLIRGEDAHLIRRALAISPGELTGVTVYVGEQLLSVMPHGSVTFVDPQPADVIDSMQHLIRALAVPEEVRG